jgi:branched-chain amino acid transport system ATP-binding protein
MSRAGSTDRLASALELTSVVAGYRASTVLRKVDLTVPQGTIVALLGPNGAGKSTLLRVAAGLLRADAGEVRLAGEPVTRHRPFERARLGLCLIPEGRGIFPSLSVEDNLRMQVPQCSRDRDYAPAFDAFPVLARRRSQLAGSLSGGEQQMLALSRCFLSESKLVLLDEVSMGLAPRVLDDIFAALRTLPSRGVAVLLVEQYVDRALQLASHAYLLTRGRITFSGAPSALDSDELMEHYVATHVRGPQPNGVCA